MINLDEARVQRCSDPLMSAAADVHKVAKSLPPSRSATLARVIEADIIPRLLLAGGRPDDTLPTAALDVDNQDIDDFARMMINLDLAQAKFVIAGAIARGVALESVLLELLAPTAQRLGAMWTDDLCSFTDVTVGLCALQSLLRSYASGEFVEPAVMHDGRALMAAPPEEQHTFGVLILEAFFRRAGWDVVGMPLATRDEVLACVSRKFFSIVGFSLSRDTALPGLRDLITAVRRVSINSEVVILVGGRVFNDSPENVRAVGADLTATDADRALVASQNVLCSRIRTH